jgi:hypothetical protein
MNKARNVSIDFIAFLGAYVINRFLGNLGAKDE